MKHKLSILYRVEPDGTAQWVHGRVAWALRELHKAGPTGCTPITTPGPRWSGYTLLLRQRGLSISTLYERHGGPFPGTHGRYVLNSRISILEVQDGSA